MQQVAPKARVNSIETELNWMEGVSLGQGSKREDLCGRPQWSAAGAKKREPPQNRLREQIYRGHSFEHTSFRQASRSNNPERLVCL